MANFLNDGSLIGLWPLNEPSGTPIFLNYSPARSRQPSGISFDFHVAQAESEAQEQVKSVWPGTASVFNPESGVTYNGYMVQGYWKLGADSSPYSKYLVMGNGCSQSREQTLAPNVVNSGITVGIWVYPNSNGYLNYYADANGAFDINIEAVRCHCLFTQKSFNSTGGWQLGVSGSLNGGAQFNSVVDNNQLTAFLSIDKNNATPTLIRTPIESGCYTHLTFTFRYINGLADEIVLYKNGRLAASGTVSTAAGGGSSTSLGNATLITRALAIGGGNNVGSDTNNYNGTSGWNHLVSGAYLFRRVLHEGEILDLHNGSTLQPLEDNIKHPIKVELTDSQLLAYYPFRSVGYADVTKNHRPLLAPKDEGPTAHYVPVPGPYRAGALLQNGTNTADGITTSSGLLYDMLNSRSWTIGVIAGPTTNLGRPHNMIFSMGSVSAVGAGAPTAVSAFSFGMALTEINTPNRMRFSAYPLGNIVDNVFNIDGATSGFFRGVSHHYAVAYDDGTRGIALYLDGHLQGSGTIAFSLTDHLIKLAGSGFPLMFTNGISDSVVDSTSHGVNAAGGQDMLFGPVLIMGRALLPEEIMYVAQSGIDTTATWRTPYDPRLLGYWPCSDYKLDDVIVEDRARPWNEFPGNLTRGETTTKWSAYYGNIGINPFNTRTTPAALDSYGVLGITSGIFGVHGLSPGTANVGDALSARSSISNFTQRYKPVNERNNTTPQNIIGEFVLGFEVTPSGTIPSTPFGLTGDNTKFEFNSTLSLYGNLADSSSDGELRSFLTTVNAGQGSGITIVFASRTGTFSAANYVGLVSGVLPFGIPSKILFHTKFDAPYNVAADTAGVTPVGVSLYINGVLVQRRRLTAATAKVWVDALPDSTGDDLLLEFGGEAGNDSIATKISRDGGLGDIYMREIFLMRGVFEKGEVEALATSGIQNPTIAGYTSTLSKTQVNITDASLQGYWRFNGLDGGGSGTTDLSLKAHHLTPLSEQKNRAGASTQASRSFKFLPGPLKNSDLLVQCSGLSYTGSSAGAASITPPFAVSGNAFNNPQDGFSVGFLIAKRTTPSASTAESLLTYGIVGENTITSTTNDFNRGWNIVTDQGNDIKMVMSFGGNGYLANTNNAAQSGQIVCGTFEADSIYEDLTRFGYLFGMPRPPRLDFWSHACWTYNATQKVLKCYINGQEVDSKDVKFAVDPLNGGPASGLNPIVPVNPAARMITFFSPSNASPWDFSASSLNDENSVITDVFYFSKALTEPEVRYIAENGIDGATGTVCSGIIGGYILGSDVASGIIGGYNRGLDTVSGIIGGLNFAAFDVSGIIGGYVSGVIFQTDVSGIIGGYIRGSDAASGIIGGFIRGSDIVSGVIGGYIIGGLRNSMQFDGSFVVQAFAAKDFDSQLTIRKTVSSDFDAKVVIFQAETGPIVDIIVPSSTVSGIIMPQNQYFIGAASGTQGKTITQTRWTFGDLTPTVSVAESGAGLYPVQHYYAASGFFIAKFEAIDSNGIHGSAIRIINATSGISPVIVSLSGVPRSGNTALTVDFTTTIDQLPIGVAITASLLNFDDGQSTITFNPTHVYTEPGIYKPIWVVRDSRGVIWGDSLAAGNDYLSGQ